MSSARSSIITALLWACMSWAGIAHAQTNVIKTLVLYDAPAATVDANKMGLAYAIMLRNLLGHWNTTVDLVPVTNYAPGQIGLYGTVFYIGSQYDNPIPAALLVDLDSNTTANVVWFKYNVWKYAWNAAFNFNSKYGFGFSQLVGLNASASTQNPAPGFYDTVTYKGRSLVKYYAFNATTGVVAADPDVGAASIFDPAKAQVLVSIGNSTNGGQLPYVIRSGKFWYVADIPLSFIGPRDRYLVLCDMLHDMLGVNTPASKSALVRLEDVTYLVDPSTTKQLTDYLLPKGIKFGIAVIPHYRDPLGAYNGGVPQDIPFANDTPLKTALNYMIPRGGRVVAHGWTHQYSNVKNPWSGVSGDDYEFWNIVTDTPIDNDSAANTTLRVTNAKTELGTGKYAPFAWEMPHYQASPVSYQAAKAIFPLSWGRVVYYTSQTPNMAVGDPNRDFAVGQFYPYVIKRDYYGNKVLPENLGNIEYDLGAIDPSSNYNYTVADILLNADDASVVRDGFASFFFHPFWLEASLGEPGFSDFQALIDGITSRGYVWRDPTDPAL